jgi:hypothetical protein
MEYLVRIGISESVLMNMERTVMATNDKTTLMTCPGIGTGLTPGCGSLEDRTPISN